MLSVRDHRELQAAVLAMKAADRGLRTEINRATVRVGNDIWRPAVMANATRHLDARMVAVGARVKAGNPPVAMAANSRRPVGGRLIPSERWPAWEFGAGNRNAYTRYQRTSPRGTVHTVERRTMRGLPARVTSGRVAFPAFADIAPRIVSLWVQLIVRTYAEAAERRR